MENTSRTSRRRRRDIGSNTVWYRDRNRGRSCARDCANFPPADPIHPGGLLHGIFQAHAALSPTLLHLLRATAIRYPSKWFRLRGHWFGPLLQRLHVRGFSGGDREDTTRTVGSFHRSQLL